jgi:peptidoglycan/xylan/chitin deacetylase (PgdA/CDA1 family)
MLMAADIRELRNAGMTIGFHTLHHGVLPTLDDAALDLALTEGRQELAAAAGAAITTISYPHGRCDTRVARAAERHGFAAGFIAGGRGATAVGDRWQIPRWDPGSLGARELIAQAMIRVHV